MASWSQAFSVNNKYNLTLIVTEKSTDVAANTSLVEYKLVMAVSGFSGYSDYRTQISCDINGSNVYSYNASRDFNPSAQSAYSETLCSGTLTIPHNADGTKTISCAASVSVASGTYSPGSASISGKSLTLTTIPRASSASWSGDFTIGSGKAITIDAASSAFSHVLTMTVGNATFTANVAAGTGSYTWTPASGTFASQFPTQTSRAGTMTLQTKSGSTVIGSNSYSFTLKIPDSWAPSLTSESFSPYSDNTFINGLGIYVAGYSKINISAAATSAAGTSIAKWEISGALSHSSETTATSFSWRSGVVSTSGRKSITIKVTDKRGRSASFTSSASTSPESPNFVSYSAPAITSISYARGTYSGGSWTASDIGTDLKITFTGTCSLTGYSNNLDWSIGAPISQSGTNTVSGTSVTRYKTGIGTTTAYNVTVTITDDVGNSTSRSVYVPTIEIPFVFDPIKPAIGIGAVPQTARTLELANNWQLNPGKGIVGYRKVFSSSRNLSAAGWYNFLIFNSGSVAERNANRAFVVDINIMRTYNNGNNEVYHTKFMACYANFNFVDDFSRANTQYITQVRYAYDSTNVGYLQLYYNATNLNEVTVECTVYAMNLIIDKFEAGGLSNGGGTASATHDLSANFLQNVFSESHTSASVTIAANGSGYVDVTITKAGFTPIGVIGIGGGSTNLPIASCQVTSTTNARIYVRNVSSAAVSCTFTLKILYVKT